MCGFTPRLQTSPPQHRLAGRSLSEGCGDLAPWSRGPLASGNGTRGWRNNHGDMGTPWECMPVPRVISLRQRAHDTTAGPLYISLSSFPPKPAQLNRTTSRLQTSPPQYRLAGRSLSEGCGDLAPWSRGPLASGNGTRGWRNNHGDSGTPWLCMPGPRIMFLRQRAPTTPQDPQLIS